MNMQIGALLMTRSSEKAMSDKNEINRSIMATVEVLKPQYSAPVEKNRRRYYERPVITPAAAHFKPHSIER